MQLLMGFVDLYQKVISMTFIEKFEEHALAYGYDLTLASCGCCRYKDMETEHFYRGWSQAIGYVGDVLGFGEINEKLS